MASMTIGSAIRQVHRLFDEGSSPSMDDGPLLRRFLIDRDDRAFEGLVNRHGPMVLATCRAVLGDRHEAEDAFQSAFLALARRAGSIRGGDSLGGWLHRVAYREAVRLGVESSRRRASEREAAATRSGPETALDRDEVRAIVHAEVDRLPEAFRMAVVLCDFEGLTKGQAAHHLGWPEPTVRGRLERARALLRDRLARRGFGSPTPPLAPAIVPARLAIGTVSTATRISTTAGLSGPGLVLMARWKMVATIAGLASACVVAMVGFGTVGEALPIGGDRPGLMADILGPADDPVDPDPDVAVEVTGRVLDPDGRPVVGATIRPRPPMYGRPVLSRPSALSGPDGRFTLRGRRSAFGGKAVAVIASAPGFGIGSAGTECGVASIRLVRDDAPIEARILDLEGRPVAGASVRVAEVWAPTSSDLSAWASKVVRQGGLGPSTAHDEGLLDWVADGQGPAPSVGADGRFRVDGIGRDRVVGLVVAGPGIESARVYALTRPGEPVKAAAIRYPLAVSLYHPNRFEHRAGPDRPIEGTVTDRASGKPIAGVRVVGKVRDDGFSTEAPDVAATTDLDGHYRLLGLPKGPSLAVLARPSGGLPYPTAEFEVGAGGPMPDRVDIGLRWAVLVRGRVVEKGTRRPIAGASVRTYTFAGDPCLRDYPGYAEGETPSAWTDAEGRFDVIALPGRGLLAARVPDWPFLRPSGVEAINGYDSRFHRFFTKPYDCQVFAIHALAEIKPGPDVDAIVQDLEVDPGRTLPVVLVDPEGQSLIGTTAHNLTPIRSPRPVRVDLAAADATGLNPAHPRVVWFVHEGRKLAGSVRLRGDEPAGQVTLRLQPWAAATGRVVDAQARPLSGSVLIRNLPDPAAMRPDSDRVFFPLDVWVELDRDGRFRVDRLIPGGDYRLMISSGDRQLSAEDPKVRRPGAGEVEDLGTLRALAEPD